MRDLHLQAECSLPGCGITLLQLLCGNSSSSAGSYLGDSWHFLCPSLLEKCFIPLGNGPGSSKGCALLLCFTKFLLTLKKNHFPRQPPPVEVLLSIISAVINIFKIDHNILSEGCWIPNVFFNWKEHESNPQDVKQLWLAEKFVHLSTG